MGRVSGPMIDRIDIHIEVPPVPWRQLRGEAAGLASQAMREQVLVARAAQARRFPGHRMTTNATMNTREVRRHCKLDEAGEILLKQAMMEMGLSARGHDKVLRIARTIADIEGDASIQSQHVGEAVQYRRLDRRM